LIIFPKPAVDFVRLFPTLVASASPNWGCGAALEQQAKPTGIPACLIRIAVLRHGREQVMASGKVKWFDNRLGFGFIAQESGQDVFVHHTSIVGKGYKTLHEGESVSFDLITSEKGPKAKNVQRGPGGET
jgi:CspA family cold shock protein